MSTDATQVRQDFRVAATEFGRVTGAVQAGDWSRIALGQWTIRDLVGHTSRALTTVEEYLRPHEGPCTCPDIEDALSYYRAMVNSVDHQAVAERGRAAARDLGEDPPQAVAGIAARVLDQVDEAADDAVLRTPAGAMTLVAYLPSRTFELVVHTLDLAESADIATSQALIGPISRCLHLATDLAAQSGRGAELLLTLTGRRPLRAGFTVM
ncbi:MAG: mycothiol maleylpyruvate isomerase [Micrococcales bacterium]|nr:MAG: mycothiol maleylpyruvate isomerase [Micrococcales bacterium]PIE26985.1 MAG: mycothiol maleylpyruvate isomerase [Micrococcales bacterium]